MNVIRQGLTTVFTAILQGLLGTPGKRLYATIVAAQVLYLIGHVVFGLRLIRPDAPFLGILLAITIIVAAANMLSAVPVWVFAGLSLFRGPRALVRPPEPVSDDQLPDIVVQIPGRNEPLKMVRRSIDSVLKAEYPPDKLTVQFFDNSDDERWRRVATLYADEPRVSVEHRDGTSGFKAGNLNRGLQRLDPIEDPSHTLIGLLDVGDTFAPAVLRPMATEFVRDPRLGFVQGMFRTGNPRDTIISWTESLVGDAARRYTEGFMAHYGIPTLNGHCALLRMQALDEVGRWNEARVAEDWSTGISLLSLGWRGKWVDYAPRDPEMVSTELVPTEVQGQQKQKRRWATGATELTKLHLVEWMQSNLPWNQRFALFLRLGANMSVLPAFIVTLLFPLWLALAISGQEPIEVVYFGVLSSFTQSPYLAANLAAAINHAREGRWRKAIAMLVAYPIDAFWRLPIFAHAGLGIAEGLSRGLKEFVITPKTKQRATVRGVLRSQRLVIAASLFSIVPLIAVLAMRPGELGSLLVAASLPPLLTIAALFLVPSTEWLRRRIGTDARGRRQR